MIFFVFLLFSIQSTMNQLYPFVEAVLKNYSSEALIKLFQHLLEHPGEGQGELLNCFINEEYVIKRLIAASLSREGDVKFNAYFALSTILTHLPHLSTSLNVKALTKFVLTQSNIKKNCEGKSSDIQAYSIGKILIVKALNSLFKDNIEIINHLIELCGEHNDLQEQIIELVNKLSSGKKAQLAFSKIRPNTKAGFVLFTILMSKHKGTKPNLNDAAVGDVLNELVPLYPKRSICLSYLGKELRHFSANTAQLLQNSFDSALKSETEETNFKKLYYILQLLQSHLSGLVITPENAELLISPTLIGSWLGQLKVQNKYIRKQAESIKIDFEDNEDFAFEVLKQIHEAKINLSNINIRHPLFTLFQTVKPDAYFDYLFDLCSHEQSEIDTEQSSDIPLNELEFFITISHDKLKPESLVKAIEMFVNDYHKDKNENALQTLSSIFNSFLPHNHKKKQKLLTKQSQILAKFNCQTVAFGENGEEIKNAIKDLRKKIKQQKEEQSPLVISYLNFLVNVGFYFFMYPEEVQIYQDLKMAFEDIKKNFVSEEAGKVPKKKTKLNPENERNKPIHILVDVFVSLLTKSPHFLRNAVNNLFEQIVPFLGTEDLTLLLGVVQNEDKEYLEQIENE